MKYLAFLIILIPFPAVSCSRSCPDLADLYANSKYVFTADVVKVEKYGIDLNRGEPKIRVEFSNIKNIKGDWSIAQIKTIQNTKSCHGVAFKAGSNYISLVSDENAFHFCNTFKYTSHIESKISVIKNGS